MIAMALVNNPDLLIADEPTTALDVTVQAQILDLIRDLQGEFGSAVIIITHDLGVVAELADDILVMYAGRGMEYDRAQKVFTAPEHPYTWGLLASMPRLDREVRDRLKPIDGTPPSLINPPSGCPFHPRCPFADATAFHAPQCRAPAAPRRSLRVACHIPHPDRLRIFAEEVQPNRRTDDRAGRCSGAAQVTGWRSTSRSPKGLLRRQVGAVRAVDGMDFTVHDGGDTRPGRRVGLRQDHHRAAGQPAAGADRRPDHVRGARHHATCRQGPMRPLRRDMQMIFQDPYSSLNPRHTVGAIVGRPVPDAEASRPARRDQARGAGPAGAGRAEPGALQPLPARVLRRAAPAHRDRPGAGPAAEADRRATSRCRRWTCRSRPRW